MAQSGKVLKYKHLLTPLYQQQPGIDPCKVKQTNLLNLKEKRNSQMPIYARWSFSINNHSKFETLEFKRKAHLRGRGGNEQKSRKILPRKQKVKRIACKSRKQQQEKLTLNVNGEWEKQEEKDMIEGITDSAAVATSSYIQQNLLMKSDRNWHWRKEKQLKQLEGGPTQLL